MNEILSVEEYFETSQNCNVVEIKHSKGCLRSYFYVSNMLIYNGTIVRGWKKMVFNKLDSFSKEELLNIQNILFKAYFFSLIKVEEAIKLDKSKVDLEISKRYLDKIKRDIYSITKYIDDFENMQKEFKSSIIS